MNIFFDTTWFSRPSINRFWCRCNHHRNGRSGFGVCVCARLPPVHMSVALCPTGGSYWNPRPCWWLTQSFLCVGITRIYNVFRIALWVVGRVIDAIFTFLFGILLPFIRLVLTFAAAFINFMLGLLLGEFRIDFGVLFPVLTFFGAWFLWLFWPQIGCFIENQLWPFLVGLVEALALAARLIPSGYNIIARVYNNCVPAFGFLIYIVVKLFVMFMRFTVELLGEFNVWELVHSLFEIWIILCEIFIEAFTAVIAAPDSTLYTTVTQIGPIVTVLLGAMRILLAVSVWVLGKLWRVLEPLLDALVRVVRAVKKHLLLRRLLGLDQRIDSMSGLDDIDREIWAGMGQAAQRYWTEASGSEFMQQVAEVNRWSLEHPPDEYSDYFHLRHQQLLGVSKLPQPHGATGGNRQLFDVGLPPGWEKAGPTVNHTAERPRDASEFLRALGDHAERLHNGVKNREKVQHLAEEMETHRVQCKSAHCGQPGQALPHPLQAALEHQHEYGFGVLRPQDARSHRRRLTHAWTAITAGRRAVRELFDEHWHRGDGTFPRHAKTAWRALTGHSTLHETFEYVTTQRRDPIDSAMSFVPVMADLWPFRYIKAMHPPEERARFHTEWMAARAVGYNQTEIARTGRALLHVTLDPVQTHEKRGAWTPEGPSNQANLQPAETPNEVPSVPVLQLITQTDCYITPKKNPLCLPEVPPELGCLIERLFGLFPKRVPVELCNYEEECADLGFCIIERPEITPGLLIIWDNIDLWVSTCWLQNGVVWIGVALGLVFPIVKLTLQIFKALLPFLSWFFDLFLDVIPTVVSAQDLVCLIVFWYGLVLLIVLIILFRIFVLPILMFLWRTWNSLETMFSAIRSIESSRLAYLEESDAQKLIDRVYEAPPGPVLWRDPWTSSPYVVPPPTAEQLHADPMQGLRDQQSRLWTRPGGSADPYIPFVPPYEPDEMTLNQTPSWLRPSLTLANASSFTTVPMVGAEMSEQLSTEQQNALLVYHNALRSGERVFGRPTRIVSTREAHDFHYRFMPLIQSAHYSHSWFRRWANEREHQRQAAKTRRPTVMAWFRGAFLGAHHP